VGKSRGTSLLAVPGEGSAQLELQLILALLGETIDAVIGGVRLAARRGVELDALPAELAQNGERPRPARDRPSGLQSGAERGAFVFRHRDDRHAENVRAVWRHSGDRAPPPVRRISRGRTPRRRRRDSP